MTQWLRWYRGTVEDAKFRHISRQAKVSICEVVAVWVVLLEDAASDRHRGVVTRDIGLIATVLDFEDGVAERVLASMQSLGMISIGQGSITICNWGSRQFESDLDKTAAERKKRQRERLRHGSVTRDTSVSHGPVTVVSRVSHGPVTAPEQSRAETETDKKESSLRSQKKVAADAAPTPKPSRGTSWPKDAVIPHEWISDAIELRAKQGRSPIDYSVEADRFCNHFAANGKLMKDWRRCWLNWCTSRFVDNLRGADNGSGQKPTRAGVTINAIFEQLADNKQKLQRE